MEDSHRFDNSKSLVFIQDYSVCIKHRTLCNFLCSSSCCDLASLIRNIGKFDAKKLFCRPSNSFE